MTKQPAKGRGCVSARTRQPPTTVTDRQSLLLGCRRARAVPSTSTRPVCLCVQWVAKMVRLPLHLVTVTQASKRSPTCIRFRQGDLKLKVGLSCSMSHKPFSSAYWHEPGMTDNAACTTSTHTFTFSHAHECAHTHAHT